MNVDKENVQPITNKSIKGAIADVDGALKIKKALVSASSIQEQIGVAS